MRVFESSFFMTNLSVRANRPVGRTSKITSTRRQLLSPAVSLAARAISSGARVSVVDEADNELWDAISHAEFLGRCGVTLDSRSF